MHTVARQSGLPTLVGFSAVRQLADADIARLLSHAERQRADRIRHPLRRNQFICGRWLLQQMLRHAHLPPAALTQGNGGKPQLAGGWHFNLTHSGELVAAVLSRLECGIDIEAIQPITDLPELLASHFAAEWAWWQQRQRATTLPDDEFYRWWTLKEAWLKAHGTGIGAMAQSTLVNLDGDSPRCLGQHADDRSQLLELQLRPGYRAAVCLLSDAPANIDCIEFS